MTLEIYPDKLQCFDSDGDSELFVLLASSELKETIKLHTSNRYKRLKLLFCNPDKTIQSILDQTELKQADILFMQYKMNSLSSLRALKLSPKQRLVILNDRKKFPVTLETVKNCLDIAYNTNSDEFELKRDTLFEKLGTSPHIDYVNANTNTRARLTLSSSCLFSCIFGQIKPGEISVCPAGEMALCHEKFQDEKAHQLEISGEITLHGTTILHGMSYKKSDYQKELFEQLNKLKNAPVIATIKHGIITDLRPYTKEAKEPLAAIERLFKDNNDYRTLIEIGHGMNSAVKLRDENCAANEFYANNGICVHFGIGNPDLNHIFHLDILCPDTKMEDHEGNNIMVSNEEIASKLKVNNQSNSIKITKSPSCLCD